MARLCERPGCSQVANAVYGIDADRLVVWLDGFDATPADRMNVLCRRHADAMVVPLGWMLDDRRSPTPQLFHVPDPVSLGSDGAAPSRRARSSGDVPPDASERAQQLDLTGEFERPSGATETALPVINAAAAANVAAESAALPVSTESTEPAEPAVPWKPVFDPTDDLDGQLATTSPLLARAFLGRQRTDRPPTSDAAAADEDAADEWPS
jgi:hypothetical protein